VLLKSQSLFDKEYFSILVQQLTIIKSNKGFNWVFL